MPVFKVKVKWGKNTYSDIELNSDEDPLLFKAQIFALTGVQPDRQKVMLKGAQLKDDGWGDLPVKNGATFLMLGTAEELALEPEKKTVFMEDLSEAELNTKLDLPAGLVNLGNTCYMNATVQCLKTVPELKKALVDLRPQGSSGIVDSLSEVFRSMQTGSCVPPLLLLGALHRAVPRFAEKGPNGGLCQQDASECWTEMVRLMQNGLPADNTTKHKSLIEEYMGGRMSVTLECTEAESEPPVISVENFLHLSCFIGQETGHMNSGLKAKIKEQISKMSTTLGRDAVFTKTSLIDRLPAYLTVQFVRFYYKEREAVNAKILKDVKFPLQFDAWELCSPRLQALIEPARAKFKEIEDNKVANALEGKDGKPKSSKEPEPMEVDKEYEIEPFSFPDDPGSNNSGFYELQAVLTHRGRSSSSGHYVAWVKGDAPDVWYKCDDDVVSPITDKEILKLSGGGDWHVAYMLLYGPRVLKVPKKTSDETSEN
ncbi:ubiquitin carboxyl-terminal hydrolase 14 [Neocloeon triangulifer]|uniref:ubiquitin carboxyl-terminal hydrolase 14 n=1 Tax=Neocloeon triangulifer TaxID=2078957 RepID=UPI00286F27EB|nr:ubiquitin carboxyl-terminal hydrolase 14 [Neocloeon triangulifer]XP_059475179.1 ubiquitin carboxyl-terminal hydrolase 14 [Neocloeon triangulifer]